VALELALHRNFGLAVQARYSRATAKLDRPAPTTPTDEDVTALQTLQPPAGTLQIDVGGFQVGGGIRVYF